MNTKAQGDVGVAMAIAHYTLHGNPVSVPLGDNTRYDLVVEIDGTLKKVQCKTTNFIEKGSYKVQLRTHGGNKTGTTTKLISSEEADLVFVYAFDGSWWEFPQSEFVGKVSLTLGPTKAQYRVN